jgi:hypothetical protein
MNKPSKTQLKTLTLRVAALRAELTDPYTVSLGPAAVRCVQESLDRWEAELAALTGSR